MSKPIKIVNVIKMEDGEAPLYLDDQGRVWYMAAERHGDGGAYPYTYTQKWQQVELPEEPRDE